MTISTTETMRPDPPSYLSLANVAKTTLDVIMETIGAAEKEKEGDVKAVLNAPARKYGLLVIDKPRGRPRIEADDEPVAAAIKLITEEDMARKAAVGLIAREEGVDAETEDRWLGKVEKALSRK
jgi:hypothetical protein